MNRNRRDFMKGTGAVAALAMAGGLPEKLAAAHPSPADSRVSGMAHGLTLLNIRSGADYRLGVKNEKGILDVVEAGKILHMHAPATIDDLLQNQDGPSLNALVDATAKSKSVQKAYLKEDTIEYGPIVTHPEKIVCVGLNYRQHALEIGAPIPKHPVDYAMKFDYEVELVMVVGREAKMVTEADALSYIAGYATGNDFTARDLQLETGGQWMVGKTPDQFAPVGPYLVTADQIDPDNLKLECRVNGETRQSSNTSDFIFNARTMISYISRVITLRPGDIIFTGTPQGVIQGKPKDKQVWLKPGDKIACSLEKLGELKFELV